MLISHHFSLLIRNHPHSSVEIEKYFHFLIRFLPLFIVITHCLLPHSALAFSTRHKKMLYCGEWKISERHECMLRSSCRHHHSRLLGGIRKSAEKFFIVVSLNVELLFGKYPHFPRMTHFTNTFKHASCGFLCWFWVLKFYHGSSSFKRRLKNIFGWRKEGNDLGMAGEKWLGRDFREV